MAYVATVVKPDGLRQRRKRKETAIGREIDERIGGVVSKRKEVISASDMKDLGISVSRRDHELE